VVREAVEQLAEAQECGQQGHNPRIPEAQGWGVQTVSGGRRSGHLGEGDHIGSRSCGVRFGVTQTPVGGLANAA
jgi:hypothetical protein